MEQHMVVCAGVCGGGERVCASGFLHVAFQTKSKQERKNIMSHDK